MRPMTLAWLAASSLAAGAALLSPDQAGFHDCQIVLQREQAQPDEILPYVAYVDREGKPTAWMFDAFMIGCEGVAPSGAAWSDGMTTAADWRAHLDRVFDRVHGLPAVQDAIVSTARQLRIPPAMCQAIIAVPYASPAQREFGDINGDGRTEDLSLPQNRDRVLRWYVEEAEQRFRSAGLPRLSLWGFCWTSRPLEPSDAATVRRVASHVHSRQLRLLWTPHLRTPGWDRWAELGFDAAVLRPGYADDYGEGAHADRLVEAAELAQQAGLGIAIEAPYALPESLRAREVFLGYLSYGAPLRGAYAKAARVHSDSLGVYAQLAASPDGAVRALYDRLADFVRGSDVPLPGGLENVAAKKHVGGASTGAPALVDGQVWTRARSRTPMAIVRQAEEIVTLDFPQARPVDLLEVSVRREAGQSWQGRIVAEVPTVDGSGWLAVGWCRADIARGPDPATYKAVLDVPVFVANTKTVRLTFSRLAPSGTLSVDEILSASPAEPAPERDPGIAVHAPYWIRPDTPRAYPDTGRILTDGLVSTEGVAQGRSAGWSTADLTVSFLIDLGAPRAIDTVRLHCDESPSPAAMFPGMVAAELWPSLPEMPFATHGRGAAPAGAPRVAMAADPTKLVVDSERAMAGGFTARQGHIDLSTPEGRPTSARYILIRAQRRQMLLLSEIEVLSGGRSVGIGARYTCWPPPTPANPAFGDDGTRLTDGRVASVLDPDKLVSLPATEDSAIVIDLGRLTRVREVGAHLVAGGRSPYGTPGTAAVSLSVDGVDWREAGEAGPATPQDDRPSPVTVTVPVRDTQPCRFVAVRLRPRTGRMALSEVTVR